MIESGGRFGFAPEPCHGFGVGGYVVGKKLECNVAPEAGVLRLVHHTHAAAPQPFNDFVV